MKKKIYLIISVLITAVLMTGCENLYHDAYNSASPNVYVAGLERGSASYDNALYWKKGEMHRLTNYIIDPDPPCAGANSIFVYEGEVYIAGTDNGKAYCYTEAGGLKYLTGSAEGKSVFVYKEDIYILGSDSSGYPLVFKNGIPETAPLENYNISTASSIFVYKGDVYVTGKRNTDPDSSDAVYWKNGEITSLTAAADGVYYSATSIFVYNGDIYITGDLSTVPKLWKNNVLQSWTFNYASNAKSVFVSNGDVYIAGDINNNAVYWENGKVITLSESKSYATSVFIYNEDVYVAGQIQPDGNHEVATYWKNGEAVTLYNGTYNTQALSIFVSGE